MPAISYLDFSGGLDRRLPINLQDASRLWVLRNAYVTLGKRIRKRPGLRRVAAGLTGSCGLRAISGRLKVFTDRGASFLAPAQVDAIALDVPAWASGQTLAAVHYADQFSGFPYVVAGYSGGAIGHHYVDANPSTVITDANNPRSISVTKAASRVFAINGETVRYCAAGNPRDWTSSSDAGFLPVGLQQDTHTGCTAVGTFQDALVVFFSEGAQIWDVATDPTANSIRKRLAGIGITNAPLSQASFANDLAFLSPYGFRSMTVTSQTDRIDDTDLGVPIDTLVVPDIATAAAQPDRVQTFGVWVHELGQYWCVMDAGATSKVWAYSYSRSSKIACWSEYTFPVRITGLATLAGKVYLRTVDELYEVAAGQYTDAGQLVAVQVQMAYQDAKAPGLTKMFWGMDCVLEGSPDVSFKYDPRDQGKETISQRITGDTRPGDLVPVELCSTAVAPVFRHAADEAFELSALQLYFNPLGPLS
jgi:hypothetical protein